jgi:hypothetical protein
MRRFVLGCFSAMLLAHPLAAGTVDASKYDAFWLWSGVAPQPVLARARTVYVLQGQIEAQRGDESRVHFTAQRGAIPNLLTTEIWLAYRAHTLHWAPRDYEILLAQLERWRHAGNRVVGVQIDFDAHTLHLQEYLEFLKQLRLRLPPDYRLGITGLMDWSSRVDPDEVNQLRGIVDEIVVQTYQGRHTIENYAAYLPRVSRLNIPFKLGLIQGGDWNAPDYLVKSPWFRGYVVFLQNSKHPQ